MATTQQNFTLEPHNPFANTIGGVVKINLGLKKTPSSQNLNEQNDTKKETSNVSVNNDQNGLTLEDLVDQVKNEQLFQQFYDTQELEQYNTMECLEQNNSNETESTFSILSDEKSQQIISQEVSEFFSQELDQNNEQQTTIFQQQQPENEKNETQTIVEQPKQSQKMFVQYTQNAKPRPNVKTITVESRNFFNTTNHSFHIGNSNVKLVQRNVVVSNETLSFSTNIYQSSSYSPFFLKGFFVTHQSMMTFILRMHVRDTADYTRFGFQLIFPEDCQKYVISDLRKETCLYFCDQIHKISFMPIEGMEVKNIDLYRERFENYKQLFGSSERIPHSYSESPKTTSDLPTYVKPKKPARNTTTSTINSVIKSLESDTFKEKKTREKKVSEVRVSGGFEQKFSSAHSEQAKSLMKDFKKKRIQKTTQKETKNIPIKKRKNQEENDQSQPKRKVETTETQKTSIEKKIVEKTKEDESLEDLNIFSKKKQISAFNNNINMLRGFLNNDSINDEFKESILQEINISFLGFNQKFQQKLILEN